MALPKLFTKRYLGIDIGTTAVRIVELEDNTNLRLANYGEMKTEVASETLRVTKKAITFFSAQEVSEIIKAIITDAKIHTRQCAFSIPDFSTFFTNFKLPPMTAAEINEAVLFEARQHIPLPLESVTIDWQLVGGAAGNGQELEIVLAAIPNEIIQQYKEIAHSANLEVLSLEAEVFGLIEALVPANETCSTCLVDIGTQSTVCSIAEGKILKTSHSFDMAGHSVLDKTLDNLPLEDETIRQIKKNYGMKFFSGIKTGPDSAGDGAAKIKSVLGDSLGQIVREVDLMIQGYERSTGKPVAKVMISGGVALVPDVLELFKERLKREVIIADPFWDINYPSMLAPELHKVAPIYTVAVGMARRAIEVSQKKRKKNQKRL